MPIHSRPWLSSPSAPRLLAVALFAAIGVATGMVASADYARVRGGRDAPGVATRGASALPSETAFPRAALADIALFGTPRADGPLPPTAATSIPAAPAALPVTAGDLQLFGVLRAAVPGASLAIIGTADGPQLPVRTGDTAPDGARVEDIVSRGVVLLREGRREWLPLPVDTATTGEAPAIRKRFMPRPVRRLAPPALSTPPITTNASRNRAGSPPMPSS